MEPGVLEQPRARAHDTATGGQAVRIGAFAVRDFRNVARADLAIPQAGAAIVGLNGQGKTNLLEAVYYLQMLRSFRNARDTDVTRFGAHGFHLTGEVTGSPRGTGVTISVGFDHTTRQKKVLVNHSRPTRLSDAFGAMPAVMCSPDDRQLVVGEPARRRRYLDLTLAAISPRYLHALQQYRVALARRNAVSRSLSPAGGDDALLAVWEPHLAEHGAAIVTARREWVTRFSTELTRLCAAIGETDRVEMAYRGPALEPGDPEASLRQMLEHSRPNDVRRGITGVGPHRDDLRLALGGRDMREFASAGQQRTAAIALRILEARTLREVHGSQPLLLLDDPFAELDEHRAGGIMQLLDESHGAQTIVCVPRASELPPRLAELETWRVEGGEVRT